MKHIHKKFYVYVLFSLKDRGFYIGYTTDLKSRLSTHSKGLVHSTKNRLPLLLIYYEYFIAETDAKSREIFLKSGYGRKQLQTILQANTNVSKR
ncbi:MAG: GIY-YIG nuclease family protein [Patescibacteria group bacterium]|nr:GIY-YIG nuclease family protein [Patescibacteria group bacterium]